MKLQRSGWLVVALLVVGARANAQTIYRMTNPFLCDASGYYPITNFEGQVCRGVPLDDSSGQPAGTAYIFSALREGMALPNVSYDPYGSITKWDSSTSNSFQFEWEQDGHKGTATGTWQNVKVCGNRCWYHPELLTFTVTVN